VTLKGQDRDPNMLVAHCVENGLRYTDSGTIEQAIGNGNWGIK